MELAHTFPALGPEGWTTRTHVHYASRNAHVSEELVQCRAPSTSILRLNHKMSQYICTGTLYCMHFSWYVFLFFVFEAGPKITRGPDTKHRKKKKRCGLTLSEKAQGSMSTGLTCCPDRCLCSKHDIGSTPRVAMTFQVFQSKFTLNMVHALCSAFQNGLSEGTLLRKTHECLHYRHLFRELF